MLELQQTHILTDFIHNHEEHTRRIKETGVPEVLTIDGRAEFVLQDADSYEALLETLRATEDLAAVRDGLEQAEKGLGRDAREVLTEIKYKHGL